jgi:hypothetical protein
MFGQSLRQELLVDRHLASLKQFDLLPVVVDTHHLVFKFGKTSGLPRALYTQNLLRPPHVPVNSCMKS